MLLVKAVECGECKNIVYSRTEDDVRECSCGRVSVSGGLQYFNYEAHPDTTHEIKKIEVRANPTALYDDWYTSTDQYGCMCPDIEQPQTDSAYIA